MLTRAIARATMRVVGIEINAHRTCRVRRSRGIAVAVCVWLQMRDGAETLAFVTLEIACPIASAAVHVVRHEINLIGTCWAGPARGAVAEVVLCAWDCSPRPRTQAQSFIALIRTRPIACAAVLIVEVEIRVCRTCWARPASGSVTEIVLCTRYSPLRPRTQAQPLITLVRTRPIASSAVLVAKIEVDVESLASRVPAPIDGIWVLFGVTVAGAVVAVIAFPVASTASLRIVEVDATNTWTKVWIPKAGTYGRTWACG